MSAEPLLIFTWYWQQTPPRGGIDAEKVNRWAAQLREHLTIPHRLAVVTDIPQGLDPELEIIEPPRDFEDVRIKQWSEGSGMPQCYRRLAMFSPWAAEIFGAERFACTDVDMIAVANCDSIFDHDHDFRIFGGTSRARPYNGSMIQMTAGARAEVYHRFAADPIGIATAARAKYIGSDQAVISYLLPKGEATWREADGVFAWSRGFARRHSRVRHAARTGNVLPPSHMRMMFFPGFDNPWEKVKLRGAEWVYDAWAYGIKPPETIVEMRYAQKAHKRRQVLWAYDDPKRWGRWFHEACRFDKNMRCRLFIRADRPPPDGRAFVRLDQSGKQRGISRGVCLKLAERGVVTLPTRLEALWYDDKVAQYPILRRWMPRTIIATSPSRASAVAQGASHGMGGLSYPLVSKAAEGAASANVRVIWNEVEAQAEIERAFGTGIEITHGRRQQSYVYWQRLVPDQTCDYRICVVGPYWYGLVRHVRPGTITASGSGIMDVIDQPEGRAYQAARLAIQIARAIKTQWMAFDVVFDGEQPLVLEMSSAWTMKAYRDCPMFDAHMRASKRTGSHSFRIAVDILRALPENANDEQATAIADEGDRRSGPVAAREGTPAA